MKDREVSSLQGHRMVAATEEARRGDNMTAKKIGTVLDEELVRRAKVAAANEGIPLSQLLEKALQAYLSQSRKRSIADEMWRTIPIDPALFKRMMEDEPSAIEAGNEDGEERKKYPLRGLPYIYVDPTESVDEKEWEADFPGQTNASYH